MKNLNASTLIASDVWSIGCIFAELLQMRKSNQKDAHKRGPLFMSMDPWSYNTDNLSPSYIKFEDIKCIFEIIDTPNTDTLNKIENNEIRDKLLEILTENGHGSIWKRLYPGSDDYELNLLRKLLLFDVDHRMSIKEAMEHSYFREYNVSSYRNGRRSRSGSRHSLSLYKNGKKHSKYENEMKFESEKNLNRTEWRSLLLKEILEYNKEYEKEFILSGAMIGYKLDVILYGYIRENIKNLKNIPNKGLLVKLPRDLLSLCCMFIAIV